MSYLLSLLLVEGDSTYFLLSFLSCTQATFYFEVYALYMHCNFEISNAQNQIFCNENHNFSSYYIQNLLAASYNGVFLNIRQLLASIYSLLIFQVSKTFLNTHSLRTLFISIIYYNFLVSKKHEKLSSNIVIKTTYKQQLSFQISFENFL